MPEILEEKEAIGVEGRVEGSKFKPLSQDQIEKEAKKLKDERALPVKPGNQPDIKATMKWLGLLNNNHWERLAVYLYRTWPIIDREPKYIDMFGSGFTLDDIKKNHGGGKYKLSIKDTDKGFKAPEDCFFECYFEIPVSESDPIINYEELDLFSNKNRQYIDKLKLKGILDRDGRAIKPGATNPETHGGNDPNSMAMGLVKTMLDQFMNLNREQQNSIKGAMKTDDSAVAKALELVQKSGERGIDLVVERFKQEDPTKMMTIMFNMMEKMNPKGDDGKDKLFMLMISQMQESSKNQMMLMQENTRNMIEMMKMEKDNSKGEEKEEKDPFEQVERVLKMASMLGLRKGNPIEGANGWVDKVVDIGASVLPQVLNIVGMAMSNRGVIPTPVQSQVRPSNSNPGVNQNVEVPREVPTGYLARGFSPSYTPIGDNQTVPIQTPIQSPIPISTGKPISQVPNPSQGNLVEMNQQLATYTSFIVNSMNNDERGYDFARSVQSFVPKIVYLQLTNLGEEGIFNSIKENPISWNQLSVFGEERVKKFIHEFVHADEIIEQLEKEEFSEEEGEE